MTRKTVAIVGGGIAGLGAAWYAQQQDLDYMLIEASNRWGGKIRTETVSTEYGKVVIEHGPDSFIAHKPWAFQLAQQIGIDDKIIGTNDDRRKTYVLNKGKLKELPDGLMLIVPTRFLPFALSPLISPLGKLRMGIEALIPAKTDQEDESLADFVRRRLGSEALDKLAEPLMSGIYNTDSEAQSLLATFPRFRAIEQKYGSLTRGILAAHKNHPTPKKKTSTFLSFRDGMEQFVSALVNRLTGNLRLNTQLQGLSQTVEGYDLQLSDGSTQHVDQVLLALPAYAAADVLRPLASDAAQALTEIPYVNTGTISLVYRKADIQKPLDGFGLVVPRSENRQINAITISSNKFDFRAPDELILMRVFYGGARSPQTLSLDDSELEQTVREELEAILGIAATPLLTRIVRNYRATAQYNVGHLQHIETINAALPSGLWLTGSSYRGVGVPDCVHQSEQVIDKLCEHLASTESQNEAQPI